MSFICFIRFNVPRLLSNTSAELSGSSFVTFSVVKHFPPCRILFCKQVKAKFFPFHVLLSRNVQQDHKYGFCVNDSITNEGKMTEC